MTRPSTLATAGAGAEGPDQDHAPDAGAAALDQLAEDAVGESPDEPGQATIGEGSDEPADGAVADSSGEQTDGAVAESRREHTDGAESSGEHTDGAVAESPDETPQEATGRAAGESADAAVVGPDEVAEPAGEYENRPDPTSAPPASAPPSVRAPAPAREEGPDRASARRPRPAWLAPVALLLLVAVAAVAGVLALGNDGGGQAQSGDPQVPAESGGSGASDGAQSGAAPAASAPEQTVTSFYQRAAAGDYTGAWALAGPGFRSQQGGFESFRGGFDTLESIDFKQAESTGAQGDSATVQIRTVAKHSDGVDRCRGSLDLNRDGGNGWLIDRANISCPNSTRG